MVEPTRPLVRYHGGKWLLADWIISHFPAHRCYVEPFGGGGSVLIRKPRSHAEIYNDLDGEIVNLFRVVRDHGQQLREKLELTPFAREEFEVSYLDAPDPIEQARRTVMRSFMGFGSNVFKLTRQGKRERTGFRACSTRSGTTPAEDWRNYPHALPAIIDRLRGAGLVCGITPMSTRAASGQPIRAFAFSLPAGGAVASPRAANSYSKGTAHDDRP